MGNAGVNWQAFIYSELLTKCLVPSRHLVQEVGWILITNTCNELASEKAVFQKGPSLCISSARLIQRATLLLQAGPVAVGVIYKQQKIVTSQVSDNISAALGLFVKKTRRERLLECKLLLIFVFSYMVDLH